MGQQCILGQGILVVVLLWVNIQVLRYGKILSHYAESTSHGLDIYDLIYENQLENANNVFFFHNFTLVWHRYYEGFTEIR